MKKESDDWEMEELELEEMEPDLEGQNDGSEADDDGQGGQKPMKTSTMILVFLGLVVLAAIISGILWSVTHRDRGNESDPGNVSIQGTMEGSSGAGEGEKPGGGSDSFSAESETGQDSEGGGTSPEPGDETGSQSPESDGAGVDGSREPGEGNGEVKPSQQPGEGSGETDPSRESGEGNGSESSREPDSAGTESSADANRVSTLDGRVIVFTDCDDTVSPKEYVNLRLEPSTSEGNATVHCRLNYGETVHRTGISEDSGWSRVEKDGVVCYVVTSFVYVVEE